MSDYYPKPNETADHLMIYLNHLRRVVARGAGAEQIRNILRLIENFCFLYQINFPIDELAKPHEPEIYLNAGRFIARFTEFIEEFRRNENVLLNAEFIKLDELAFTSPTEKD